MGKAGLLFLVCAVVASGCMERPGARIGPNVGLGQRVSVGGYGAADVDVLFMIDNSQSMEQEHRQLAAQIEHLVRDLASPPDRDADGSPDWQAAQTINIAITTSDLGAGTLRGVDNCHEGGDNGDLQGQGVYSWRAGDDPAPFASAVGAIVDGVGIAGCGFEQQLRSAALAVSHPAQTGFPRANALLAVVVVSDEDDCSSADENFFAQSPEALLGVWCPRNRANLMPLQQILDQYRAGRSPDQFLFAAITGVPIDSDGMIPAQILAHPDMQDREEPDINNRLAPVKVCEATNSSGVSLGLAYPGRRYVELAAMVPGSVVTSICTEDFGPAIRQIAASIGSRVRGVCLARALPPAGEDQVDCGVQVRLPAGTTCTSIPGYTLRDTDELGRERCNVAQVANGASGDGFYYDGTDPDCPQLALTDDSQPPVGAEVVAECFVSVLRPDGDDCARHLQCESGYCDHLTWTCAPLPPGNGTTSP